MFKEARFNGAIKAIHTGLNRVAARIAGLTFWQFVLLAIILISAAGIGEDLWDKPASSRIHITRERSTASADKPGAVPGGKDSVTAEVHIDENGIVIRRKTEPKDKSAPPQATDKSVAATPGTARTHGTNRRRSNRRNPRLRKQVATKGPGLTRKPESTASGATAAAKESVDVQLPGIQVSDMDLEDLNDLTRHASRPHLVTIALLLVLALFVMRMFARAQQRAEQKADAAVAVADRETLQRQIVEARLQLLQAQVEPHFLFNTLAAVEHLIETAPPRAAQMQRHLIEYLRAALPRMRQQSATLGQEVELCVSYLKIMQMRMEERLQFEVAVPAGLSSASFPPMMIQSLVENSIRHGLEPKPEGGTVNLRAEVRDGKLCVTVEDTGMGFSAAAPAGIGLANIRERLQQLFGANATLTIEPAQPRGTRATITVPYAVA